MMKKSLSLQMTSILSRNKFNKTFLLTIFCVIKEFKFIIFKFATLLSQFCKLRVTSENISLVSTVLIKVHEIIICRFLALHAKYYNPQELFVPFWHRVEFHPFAWLRHLQIKMALKRHNVHDISLFYK